MPYRLTSLGLRATLVALIASISGCVAPMSLGASPVTLPAGKGVLGGSSGAGVAPGRVQGAADAFARYQFFRPLSLEAGLAVSALRQTADDERVVAGSPLPYVRPAIHVRRASLALALSGLGAGGGGGGGLWGLVSPRLGYGNDDWAIYGEWLAHTASLVGSTSMEASAQHARVGGDYLLDANGARLGIGAALTVGRERYASATSGEGEAAWEGRVLMATVRVIVSTQAF